MRILRNGAFERRSIEPVVNAQCVTSTVFRGSPVDSADDSLEVSLLVETRKQFQVSCWRSCVGQRWVSAWVETAREMVPKIRVHTTAGHVS